MFVKYPYKSPKQDITISSFSEDLITAQSNKNEPENYSHQIHNLNRSDEIPALSYSSQRKTKSLMKLGRATYVGLCLNFYPEGPPNVGTNR